MRLFIWNKREDLVRKDGMSRRGSVIALSESLPDAIAMLRDPKRSGIPEDMITDQIHNLPDINVEARCKVPGSWVVVE